VAAHAVGLRQRIVDRDAAAGGRRGSHHAFLRLAFLALTRRALRTARALRARTLPARALATAPTAAAATAPTLRRVALARFAGTGGRGRILRRTRSLTGLTLTSLALTGLARNRNRVLDRGR
jgi:hypothetical protein